MAGNRQGTEEEKEGEEERRDKLLQIKANVGDED